jgi:type VI secretion system protein ImpK
MKKDIDIDTLMADTWLTVVQLRYGVSVDEGDKLYDRCRKQVERVKEALERAHVDKQSIEHISYAQCALLDETALGRIIPAGEPDSGHLAWQRAPLQARFFGSLHAGEALYEKIAAVLRQPSPDQAVLMCFHRVLLLGFQGQYSAQTVDKQQREQAIAALSLQIPATKTGLPAGILANRGHRRRLSLLRSLWLWIGVAAVMTGAVWWGGHLWLRTLLAQQLPGLN